MVPTYAGEKWTRGGVIKPIMTATDEFGAGSSGHDLQLLNQLDAVDIAAPLLRKERGNTSVGKTQATGPKLTPYAAVSKYIILRDNEQ